jgi:PiT family inorganic phosphate transporter
MLLLVLTVALAFYVAWNLGANDVANSMGTSVGSKAVTLRQALAIAGVLEFTGAVLFGQRVSATLATHIIDPTLFVAEPQILMMGMVAVLIACGVWLQIATALGLPVASSHAVVGAIAGFGWVAIGNQAVDWPAIGMICLTWVLTPIISGAIAAVFYSLISHWILNSSNPVQRLYEWIPWLSTALVSVFGVIVLPSILSPDLLRALPLPEHDMLLAIGAIAIVSLTVVNWRSLALGERAVGSRGVDSTSTPHCPLPTVHSLTESLMARFQLLSACFVAFAHGSNDVGNAVAPLAAIAYIQKTGTVPPEDITVPTWILVIGGIGIVSGLAVLGKNVIKTIGEGIIPLQPSAGFCAELAAATTILISSRLGLPVSTSHALVGGVVGIGVVQSLQSPSQHHRIQIRTIRQIALAWLVTIPIAAGLAAGIFAIALGIAI